MPFDWDEFLTLAEELAQRNEDEAALRTSVSRAYYSAFHDALSRAERKCGPKQGGNSHQWCWDRYNWTQDPACNQIGIDGGRLKFKRVKADYDPQTIERIDEFVSRTLNDARDLKRRIAALDPQYPRP
jgi:hypothetical protein